MYDVVRIRILLDFCGHFPWFWLILCHPDPAPADQNETDPNGSGSATLIFWLGISAANPALRTLFLLEYRDK